MELHLNDGLRWIFIAFCIWDCCCLYKNQVDWVVSNFVGEIMVGGLIYIFNICRDGRICLGKRSKMTINHGRVYVKVCTNLVTYEFFQLFVYPLWIEKYMVATTYAKKGLVCSSGPKENQHRNRSDWLHLSWLSC